MNTTYENTEATKEERDYSRYCKLTEPSKELTPQESEWVSNQNIIYMAQLLIIEDAFDNYKVQGKKRGKHGSNHYEAELRTLTQDEQDAELLRLLVKCNTVIAPWLDRQQGVM